MKLELQNQQRYRESPFFHPAQQTSSQGSNFAYPGINQASMMNSTASFGSNMYSSGLLNRAFHSPQHMGTSQSGITFPTNSNFSSERPTMVNITQDPDQILHLPHDQASKP
mmetsp:Transcript_5811/g.5040  ORF Transcript_5811/g.5040 Transcript_5811/m.5040 type:complete len:111 (+) Transcript_5811:766-1098(+)